MCRLPWHFGQGGGGNFQTCTTTGMAGPVWLEGNRLRVGSGSAFSQAHNHGHNGFWDFSQAARAAFPNACPRIKVFSYTLTVYIRIGVVSSVVPIGCVFSSGRSGPVPYDG